MLTITAATVNCKLSYYDVAALTFLWNGHHAARYFAVLFHLRSSDCLCTCVKSQRDSTLIDTLTVTVTRLLWQPETGSRN